MFREPISTEGKNAVGSLAEFPLFFGTVLFALEAIGVVSTFLSVFAQPMGFHFSLYPHFALILSVVIFFVTLVDNATGK